MVLNKIMIGCQKSMKKDSIVGACYLDNLNILCEKLLES